MEYLDLTCEANIPSKILGDVIQIWEFCQRFSRQLCIDSNFSVTELYTEMVSPQSDLLDYIMSGMMTYIFNEIVIQKNTSSNYFQILEQVQSAALRKYLTYQTWSLFYANVSKIVKLRSVLQDDIKEQYLRLVQSLNNKGFRSMDVPEKCELILFLINWVIYEIEALGIEIDEARDIIEELNSGQTVKHQKNWTAQLKKIQQGIQQSQDQLRKEKRKQKKNKKQIDFLETQIDEQKQQMRRLTRLMEYDPNNIETDESKCVLLGTTGDVEIYGIDSEYVYLRNLPQDTWVQFSVEKLLTFLERVDDGELADKIQAFFQSVKKTTPTTKVQWFTFGEEVDQLLENKFQMDFVHRLNSQEETELRIKNILHEIEREYSEYEMQYWKCNWTSKERRQVWKDKVMSTDLVELQQIIAKFPHQLSFVNRKHALLEPPLPDQKFKSFRLYWFYQNKGYSQPYQSLSKLADPDPRVMLVLVITLYEKLKFYINKKVNQIQNNVLPPASHQQSEELEQPEMEIEQEPLQEDLPLPLNRLRERRQPIKYDEQSRTANVKFSKKSVEKEGSTSIEEEYVQKGDRVLRQRKKIKYNC